MNTPFKLSYEFNAPKELVFNAFSNAEALNEWWGPAISRNTVIKLDFKPGGIFHFKMDYPNMTAYGRFLFRTIQPHDLLEFTNAFADEQANVVKPPFDMAFPKEIFYRLVFVEQNNKTTIHLTGEPVNPGKGEMEGFYSIHQSMQEGFAGTFYQLSKYLTK